MLLGELSCPWPVDPENCGLKDFDPGDPLFTGAVATASSIMTRLSAYRVGICETELRPLKLCPECRSWCCGGTDGIRLIGPFQIGVHDVIRVRLGAMEYDEADWHFDRETRMLWRTPPGRWPTRDARWDPPGTGDAFVVDVQIGVPPDDWALDVAARLVKELVLSCQGSKCRLPSNTTSVTTQGITVRLRDQEINTFIPELAAWVNAVNPFNARLPGAVFSPDITPNVVNPSNGGWGCCGVRYAF